MKQFPLINRFFKLVAKASNQSFGIKIGQIFNHDMTVIGVLEKVIQTCAH